jgi:DNA sulfur modification protein DndC
LTIKARKHFLEKILDIQNRINAGSLLKLYLINEHEEARIRELINLKSYPEKWDEEKPTGDIMLDKKYSDGSIMPLLFRDWVGKSAI